MLEGRGAQALGLLQQMSQLGSECPLIGFHKYIFIRAGKIPDQHVYLNSFAPTKILFERAEQSLPARSDQDNAAGIRPLNVGNQGLEMRPPQDQLAVGEMPRVDHLFE